MSRWRTLQIQFQAMASPCTLQLDGQDESLMRRAANLAMAEVKRIEQKYSRYQPHSVVSRINQAAGSAPVTVDEETSGLLAYADQLWALSDGLFDITSGVLRQGWDFRQARIPSRETLERLLPLVNWRRVERADDQVRLAQTGMELDFGGFGKEYAADRAALTLRESGMEHALVNLGGDLHALGTRGLPEIRGESWHIDIQHPRPEPAALGTSIAFLPLGRGGLATSGDYERFFIQDGRRYCHVLNPRTGMPVSALQSISVLAATTSAAGAITTIAMLKEHEATRWLDTQGISSPKPLSQPTPTLTGTYS
jgi:FAD:protein FMN transferase